MKDVVIVSGSRTAVGAFGGGLKDVTVVELGSLVIRDVLKRVGLRPVACSEMIENTPGKLKGSGLTELEKKWSDWDNTGKPVAIDEVIMGNVLQACQGQNT